MGAMYKDYKSGLNSKGLKSKTDEQAHPRVTTERGKRRKERENKVHAHQWVNYVIMPSTSYHSARIANEQRYYCKKHNMSKKKGGGQRTGCGATCRSPK